MPGRSMRSWSTVPRVASCRTEDPAAVAEALAELIRDPTRRHAMGQAGRRRILERFAFEAGIARMAARFGLEAGHREAA